MSLDGGDSAKSYVPNNNFISGSWSGRAVTVMRGTNGPLCTSVNLPFVPRRLPPDLIYS